VAPRRPMPSDLRGAPIPYYYW